jgi:hypothetical protein
MWRRCDRKNVGGRSGRNARPHDDRPRTRGIWLPRGFYYWRSSMAAITRFLVVLCSPASGSRPNRATCSSHVGARPYLLGTHVLEKRHQVLVCRFTSERVQGARRSARRSSKCSLRANGVRPSGYAYRGATCRRDRKAPSRLLVRLGWSIGHRAWITSRRRAGSGTRRSRTRKCFLRLLARSQG